VLHSRSFPPSPSPPALPFPTPSPRPPSPRDSDRIVLVSSPDDPIWAVGPVAVDRLSRLGFVSINRSSTVYARQAKRPPPAAPSSTYLSSFSLFPRSPQPPNQPPPHLPHPSGRQREILRSAGVDADSLRVRFEVNSVEAVKNAVEEGIGVAFVSAAAAERELAAGLLKEVRLTQRGGGGGGKTGGARRQPTFRRHDLSDSSLGDGEDGGGGKDGDGANGADGEPLLLTRELLLITNPRRYLTAAARAFLRQMRRAQPLFQAKSSLVLLLL